MNTTNDKRLRMPVGDTRRALPLLAVLLLLLAGLLAWSGVRQWRDAALLDDMQRARDAAASAVESAYRAQTGQLAQRLASAPVKAALDRNDSAAAVAALREEVIAAHRSAPLSARQIELVQQSDLYLNRGQGFDMHWWAWESLMGVLERPVSADLAALKPAGGIDGH